MEYMAALQLDRGSAATHRTQLERGRKDQVKVRRQAESRINSETDIQRRKQNDVRLEDQALIATEAEAAGSEAL
jgi:hypothetical protein